MANLKVYEPHEENFQEYFGRIFQSSNINFLFGAGASSPAIAIAGDIESRIQALYDSGQSNEARKIEYEFLFETQKALLLLVNNPHPRTEHGLVVQSVLDNYERFIRISEKMLKLRKNNLLPKKINIFSTNYDLFCESAALKYKGLVLNDGFQLRGSILNEYIYDARSFSRTFFESSALYNYKVEIPVVNLIKIHGSFSWIQSEEDTSEIKYNVSIDKLLDPDQVSDAMIAKKVDEFFIIYPKKEKFRTTLMNHTYYDLLRIYSNELDKEQTTLIVFGFSFRDEHVLDLTKRALRNSTLKVVIFAFNADTKDGLAAAFSAYHNVDIIYPLAEQQIKFEQFNKALECYFVSGSNHGQ